MLIIEVRFLNDHSHCNFALIQVAIYTFQRIYALVPRMDCNDTARLWGSPKEIGETPFFYNHHFMCLLISQTVLLIVLIVNSFLLIFKSMEITQRLRCSQKKSFFTDDRARPKSIVLNQVFFFAWKSGLDK